MKLTVKARNDIPTKKFALSGRRYPIEDKNHADAALSDVARVGTPSQETEVKKKVKAVFPGIGKPAKSDLFSRLTGK